MRIHFPIWYETPLLIAVHKWTSSHGPSRKHPAENSQKLSKHCIIFLASKDTPKSWLLILESPSKNREKVQYYVDILAISLLHSFEKKRRICTAKYILFIFAVKKRIMMIFTEILPGLILKLFWYIMGGEASTLSVSWLDPSYIVGLTALRLAFFMGYGSNKVVEWFLYWI